MKYFTKSWEKVGGRFSKLARNYCRVVRHPSSFARTALANFMATLASSETVETAIGSPRALLALPEIYFQELAKGDLGDLHVLVRTKMACTAHREKLLELLLIKLNEQHLSSRPEGLIVALRHDFLIY